MAWTSGPRGTFFGLPPIEALPKALRDLALDHQRFLEESKRLRGEALSMRQQQETRRSEYEQTIAQAMLEGSALPIDPMPDFDQSDLVAGVEKRRSGTRRRQGLLRPRRSTPSRQADSDEERHRQSRACRHRHERSARFDQADHGSAQREPRPLLLVRRDRPPATNYVTTSPEAQVVDEALGRITSTLRRLDAELAELRERVAS